MSGALSDRSRRAVERAGTEVRELGHDVVGDDHLLLGLLHERRGLAARVLRRSGVTLTVSRAALGAARPRTDPPPEAPPLELAAMRALQLAHHVALERNDGPIRAAYLLIGVLEADAAAASVVRAQGAQPADLVAAAFGKLPAVDRARGGALLADRRATVDAQLHAGARRAEVSAIVSAAAGRAAAVTAVAASLGVSEAQAASVVDAPLGATTEAHLAALRAELLALDRRLAALGG